MSYSIEVDLFVYQISERQMMYYADYYASIEPDYACEIYFNLVTSIERQRESRFYLQMYNEQAIATDDLEKRNKLIEIIADSDMEILDVLEMAKEKKVGCK